LSGSLLDENFRLFTYEKVYENSSKNSFYPFYSVNDLSGRQADGVSTNNNYLFPGFVYKNTGESAEFSDYKNDTSADFIIPNNSSVEQSLSLLFFSRDSENKTVRVALSSSLGTKKINIKPIKFGQNTYYSPITFKVSGESNSYIVLLYKLSDSTGTEFSSIYANYLPISVNLRRPEITGYTVTATPVGGGTSVTATGTLSPINVTGLTEGTAYTFTVNATYADATSASAPVTSISSSSSTLPVSGWTPTKGIVADGYLAGATVFADANGNRLRDAGELSTTTDNAGNCSFDFGSLPATLVSIGGTDISTGLPFAGSLTAPAGSSVINPLTTLVTALVEADGAPADASALAVAVEAATMQVVAGLGLPAVSLTSFDPLAPGADSAVALAVQKAAASVANVIVVGNTLGADPATVVRNLATAVMTTEAGQTVDLGDATVLTNLLTTPTTPAPAPAAIGGLAASNTQIAAVGTIADIAELQAEVQAAGRGVVGESKNSIKGEKPIKGKKGKKGKKGQDKSVHNDKKDSKKKNSDKKDSGKKKSGGKKKSKK
jgi:hypothetical protein